MYFYGCKLFFIIDDIELATLAMQKDEIPYLLIFQVLSEFTIYLWKQI